MDKIRKNKEMIYLISFSIYCIVSLLGASKLLELNDIIKNGCYIFSIALFVILIISNKYTKKEYIIYSIILAFSLYTSIRIHKMFFFINILSILAIKDISLKRVVKLDITIKIVILLIHIIPYLFQYLFQYELIEPFINTDLGRNRHALYFIHPNLVSQIVLWLSIDIIYISKHIKKGIIVTSIFIIITYIITDSRTMLMSYGVFLILYGIKKILNREFYEKIIHFLQKYSIDFLAIGSYILAIVYKYKFGIIGTINALTSGRIYYSYVAIEKFGVHLFPNIGAINLEQYVLIDNFYVRSFVVFGILHIVLLSIMTKLIPKKTDTMLGLVTIVFAFNLFSEYNTINIGNALPILMLGYYIVNKKKINSKILEKEKLKTSEEKKCQ